jgi:hypothetical protein
MSVKFLYYTEYTSTGGALSTATLVPYLDQMCVMSDRWHGVRSWL